MEDRLFELSAGGASAENPADTPKAPPVPEPAETPDASPDEEQTGIIPGEIPGRPTDPSDPRFPGSQPDLA
jgi:hypothetical protein